MNFFRRPFMSLSHSMRCPDRHGSRSLACASGYAGKRQRRVAKHRKRFATQRRDEDLIRG